MLGEKRVNWATSLWFSSWKLGCIHLGVHLGGSITVFPSCSILSRNPRFGADPSFWGPQTVGNSWYKGIWYQHQEILAESLLFPHFLAELFAELSLDFVPKLAKDMSFTVVHQDIRKLMILEPKESSKAAKANSLALLAAGTNLVYGFVPGRKTWENSKTWGENIRQRHFPMSSFDGPSKLQKECTKFA